MPESHMICLQLPIHPLEDTVQSRSRLPGSPDLCMVFLTEGIQIVQFSTRRVLVCSLQHITLTVVWLTYRGFPSVVLGLRRQIHVEDTQLVSAYDLVQIVSSRERIGELAMIEIREE
jgi:hypothetical protein